MQSLDAISLCLILAALVVYATNRLHVSSVVGLIITGIIAGPQLTGIVSDLDLIHVLAEIGIIMLLFTIGIEFSIKDLIALRREAIIGGGIQVTLVTLFISVFNLIVGFDIYISLFLGIITSISSTAVIVKILQKKGEIMSPYGKICVGMLIFQDILTILIMIAIPSLAEESAIGKQLFYLLIKGILVIAFIIAFSKYVIPKVLHSVAKTRDSEFFLLFIVATCGIVATTFHHIGLSLSLGAFVAGLIISESDYSHEAMSKILPFKDIFSTFFFIAVGMMLDFEFIKENLILVVSLAVLAYILKSILTTSAAFLAGFPIKVSIISGIYMGQISEFSLVLAQYGVNYSIIGPDIHNLFLTVTALTMAMSPICFPLATRLSNYVDSMKLPEVFRTGLYYKELINNDDFSTMHNHLIIVGFGPAGKSTAKAADAWKIPWVAAEMNPETVKKERAKGQPVIFGNAEQEFVLEKLNIHSAGTMIVSVPIANVAETVVAKARSMNDKMTIICRAQNEYIAKNISLAGSDEVVINDSLATFEMIHRVFSKFGIKKSTLMSYLEHIRMEEQFSICDSKLSVPSFLNENAHQNAIARNIEVTKASQIHGKSLAELNIRAVYNITVIAVKRKNKMVFTPNADFVIHNSDVLHVLGQKEEDIDRFADEMITKH